MKVLHQFLTGITAGDAISDHAFVLRGWLRELGFQSEIFAQFIHESVAAEVQPLHSYRRGRRESLAIYHHSIGSDVPPFLQKTGLPLLLIYHNITPPRFFARIEPAWAQRMRRGLEQLERLQPQTVLGLGVSPFNEQTLREVGYEETAVLPIIFLEKNYQHAPLPEIAAEMKQQGPNLLFIGRLSPNKRQEDLVKLLHALLRIEPGARLHLVGDPWQVGYDRFVLRLAEALGVAERVHLVGKVSQAAMVTYYKTADFYVSMSEHEGFGVPLIESMYFGLPLLAYGVTAVPGTMGDAGILFFEKRYAELAELLKLLGDDEEWRTRLIARQQERVKTFLAPQIQPLFLQQLRRVGVF